MFSKAYTRLGSAALTALLMICSVFFLAASGSTQNGGRDRILYAVDSAQTVAVRGTAHPLARTQFDQGQVRPDQQLTGMALTFRLSASQQADLKELLREQQDRSSPNYHKWLTPGQYAARFGMTSNDLAKVSSWLQSQGLTVIGVSRNRNEISFNGSVGQVEYALKTEIHHFVVNGREHMANNSDVSVPQAFAAEVLGVRGLNDFHPKPRYRKSAPKFTSNVSGNHFVIPADFATLYNIPSSFDGSGQTIAVVGQTLISTTDIDDFRGAAGLPGRTSSNFQQIQVPSTGTALTCTGDATEADLDVEWSEGVAKNATIKYIYAGIGSGTTCNNRTSNAFDALQYAITHNSAPIISISYGNCEANLGTSFVLTMQQWAQEANAQGQTISGPAGDSGAADCDTGSSATQGLGVDVPASIPEVTGVGGAQFTGDAAATVTNGCAAATTFWLGTCNSTSSTGTAVSYIPETTWNDNSTTGLSAGGGGASTVFAKPSWQSGTGVPGDGKRDVPDIAFNAADAHDSYLICSQDVFAGTAGITSCANGFRSSSSDSANNNLLDGVGGTSAGAPTFAGVLALINQATGSNGLGNVNPMLYALDASTPGAFHDITSGNNNVPCTAGSPNCPAGTTSIGFSAGAGYDRVTGLGSLNVANLITAWTATTSAGDFALDGTVASSSSSGVAGTSSVTVTAISGFTGTVNLTCASSASVTITCSLNPASVTFTGSSGNTQTSTLSLTASANLRMPHELQSGKPGFQMARLAITGFGATGGLFAVVLLGVPSRRKWAALFGLALLAIAFTAIGCGGGSSSVTPKTSGPQSYVVTVTGMGTNSLGTALTHSTNVSFTVQ
ncbi:MAG TPA: S53 family peptidase [Terriglobales bacterium]|jgi:subtilase family serine protease|nr:S53 family peptidase [Terriglobales bacterium]